MKITQKITTHLWFDNNAEEAVNFYVSLFDQSKINNILRFDDKTGLVGIRFTLAGQEYMALNGGPHFKLTEAVSLYVKCEDQAEVDRLWDGFLGNGGAVQHCGWLKDKYGLSWQIIPAVLEDMLGDPDKAKSARAMQAVMGMIKLDIAQIEAAYRGAAA